MAESFAATSASHILANNSATTNEWFDLQVADGVTAEVSLDNSNNEFGQDEALQEFKTLLEKSPDYTPGYFMAAQTLEKTGRIDEAKRMLVDGITVARKTGNAHAQSEMTAMLEGL